MKFKNFINKYNNDSKIFSKDDILNMSVKDAFKSENPIMAQYDEIGIPTVDELSASSNVIWVEAYTRDDGTEVRAHWRSKPDSNGITSAAAGIKEEVPAMTKGAEKQAELGKNFPVGATNFVSHAEVEYYKISLNLEDIRKSGVIPEWFSKNNTLMKVSDIKNQGLINSIKDILSNEKLTSEQLNNLDVVITKIDSDLANLLKNSSELKKYVNDRIIGLQQGQYENKLDKNLVFEMNSKLFKEPKEFAISHTIHKANVYDMKLEDRNTVSMIIVDYYDFTPGGSPLNNNAHIQQENKMLKNYMLIIPLKIKI